MFFKKHRHKKQLIAIQKNVLESRDQSYFKELYYQCYRNVMYLNVILKYSGIRLVYVKGNSVSETKKKRASTEFSIKKFTRRLEEERCYLEIYKHKASL